jgi:hypothetical protein
MSVQECVRLCHPGVGFVEQRWSWCEIEEMVCRLMKSSMGVKVVTVRFGDKTKELILRDMSPDEDDGHHSGHIGNLVQGIHLPACLV